MEAVVSAVGSVDQLIGGHTRFEWPVFKRAVALFFGKVIPAVGDDESQVAGTGLVYAGKINFVEDAVTQREPDFAVLVECGTGAGLGAGCPARRNTGPARSMAWGRIAHKRFVLRVGNPPPTELIILWRIGSRAFAGEFIEQAAA